MASFAMTSQLSSIAVNRGVGIKAPRASAAKARVATRVQAVSRQRVVTLLPNLLGFHFGGAPPRHGTENSGTLTRPRPLQSHPSQAAATPQVNIAVGGNPASRIRAHPRHSRHFPVPALSGNKSAIPLDSCCHLFPLIAHVKNPTTVARVNRTT